MAAEMGVRLYIKVTAPFFKAAGPRTQVLTQVLAGLEIGRIQRIFLPEWLKIDHSVKIICEL